MISCGRHQLETRQARRVFVANERGAGDGRAVTSRQNCAMRARDDLFSHLAEIQTADDLWRRLSRRPLPLRRAREGTRWR